MTSIKVKFRPSTAVSKEGTIYYQIIHKRVIRQLKTNYSIYADEWDERSATLILANNGRNVYLQSIKERMNWDVRRLENIVSHWENKQKSYAADDIISAFQKSANEQTLLNFMNGIIARLKQMGKHRTSETYYATLRSFMQFRESKDILLDEIDSDLMLMYEAWLHGKRITKNSSSFYMRILRAVYNRGMSFIDMAYLKKKDLQNGILSYRRRKTGQQLFIKWEKCMQEIADKHKEDYGSPYLLPILKYPYDNRSQYKNALYRTNKNLKEVAKLAGISIPLTLYVARHSWASIAKSKNIPISVISEGMGHDSEMTTQIYLASLDNSVVDKANTQILRDLM